MRHIVFLLAALAAAGCHYHDYRDYTYDGDLSRDTHGVIIYETAADSNASLPAVEASLVEPSGEGLQWEGS